MNKSFFVFTILCTLLLFTACASKEKPVKERDESFIADVSAFGIETFHLYGSRSTGKPKVYDFTISFMPRTNYIIASTRIGMNFVNIGFSYQERIALKQAHDKYIEAFNSGSIPNEKPNKKNAYSKSFTSIGWGATGISYEVIAPYMTNAQFLEPNKPYFRIFFQAEEETSGNQIYSPSFSVYISPSQWEKIEQACNQEILVEMTDKILEEAGEF